MATTSKYSIKEIYLRAAINKHYGNQGQINYFGDNELENEEYRKSSSELVKKLISEEEN